MLKNLKRASAIMLSLAMAVQFGMADTYFANTLSEEPIIEETQEQEPVTVEERVRNKWLSNKLKRLQ